MSRWFRFYDAALDDPKVQRLSDLAFRAWINLMCVASRNGGAIAGDISDVAFSLRVSSGKARNLLQVLQSAGLMDQSENGWEPHNWKTRQYESDSAAERMRRHRDGQKQNLLRHALRHSDAIEADTEQNRTEQKDIGASQAKADKPKRERRVLSGIPDDCPSELDRCVADRFWRDRGREDLCARLADEAQAFRDHHSSKGNRMADWPAAWRTWYGNALRFNRVAASIAQFPTAKIHQVVP